MTVDPIAAGIFTVIGVIATIAVVLAIVRLIHKIGGR